MSNFRTKLPQVSRAQSSESHTVSTVSLTDSGGGKNSIIALNRRPLYIATYNSRTLRTEEHLLELEQEIKEVKWHIIGLCETRLPEEKVTTLKSGHILYQNNSDKNQHLGGVALMINKNVKHLVTKYQAVSNRIIYITIKLNRRYSLQIIQVYAPTSQAEDEEVEQMYEDISRAIKLERTKYVIITGDFNAKVGQWIQGDPENIGKFGLGNRNNRGEMLINFLEKENLFCLNTFYQKPTQRKWTWRSPDGRTKNEIDYIISNSKYLCRDVSVLNKIHTGSDHRLVRAHFTFNTQKERNKLMNKYPFPTAQELETNVDKYQGELDKRLESIDELDGLNSDKLAQHITTSIQTSVKKVCATRKISKNNKLTPNTLKLIEQRRDTKRDTEEYKNLNKTVKKEIRKDIRAYNTKMIQNTIDQNKNMRVLKSKLSTGKTQLSKIKDTNGVMITNKKEIAKVIEKFYTTLYSSTTPNLGERTEVMNSGSEDIPDITPGEVQEALKHMKNGKSPGEDKITAEMLKFGGPKLEKYICVLLNKCLQEGKVPESWLDAEIILLFKKGDSANIENYRPISLLSHLYKLFTKLITNRLTSKFDTYQPVEQAGFRKGFSTSDHLQTIRSLIEKTTEYNVQLHLAFIDFRKAFDTVEIGYILVAMDRARIDTRYTTLIENIYKNAYLHIKIDDDTKTNSIKVKRGVRQGDTISPKLFTLVLEDVFKKLRWEEKGIKIDGVYLNHLRFADDIVLISNDLSELKAMLQQLSHESKRVGLEMNYSKTKIMSLEEPQISIENQDIENVSEYNYLGHLITLGKDNQYREVTRRIQLSWAAFGRLSFVLRDSSIPINLKRRVFDACVLPVTTYGMQTMCLTQKNANRLRVMQRAMERSMLGLSLSDRVRNEEIRRRTGTTDVIERIAELKWQWAGHVARQQGERWPLKILQWRPRETKRGKGRPQLRWIDDVRRMAGGNWHQRAQDRAEWKVLGKAYVQEWTR